MNEDEILNSLGYVMASSYRLNVIKYIAKGVKIPSDIVLADLKETGLVICLNEDAHKGRLYKNTELSLEILKYLENMEK